MSPILSRAAGISFRDELPQTYKLKNIRKMDVSEVTADLLANITVDVPVSYTHLDVYKRQLYYEWFSKVS